MTIEFMKSWTEKIPVQLDNGAIIKVEVAGTGGKVKEFRSFEGDLAHAIFKSLFVDFEASSHSRWKDYQQEWYCNC